MPSGTVSRHSVSVLAVVPAVVAAGDVAIAGVGVAADVAVTVVTMGVAEIINWTFS